MISVQEAEKLILENTGDYGNEIVLFEQSLGRVLAETIKIGDNSKPGEAILIPGTVIIPAVISVIASVGETELRVKRIPRVIIISFESEFTEPSLSGQAKKSSSYLIQAMLAKQGLEAAIIHIPNDVQITKSALQQCLLNYDVMLLSGDIPKDGYIHYALKELHIEDIFYEVQQQPCNSFWFGRHENGVILFGFPNDAIATLICVQRYFKLWINATLKIESQPLVYAVLEDDLIAKPQFLPVKLRVNEEGRLLATSIQINDTDYFANLLYANAFIELPPEKSEFIKGEVYRVYKW